MEYLQYVDAVKEELNKRMSETMSVEVHTVVKNNSNERVGLTISEAGYPVSPTIYLEEFYERQGDEEEVPRVAEKVLELYEEVKVEGEWDLSFLKQYESVKDKLAYKVINAKRNEAMLREVPHETYLDLAIVCYMLLETDKVGVGTILVTEKILHIWGVDKEQLFEDAKQNAKKILPASFSTMAAMMEEMCVGLQLPKEGREYLYVLTNQKQHFGAACMLYEGMLAQIGEALAENYYVIPSSIHEVLIIPESSNINRMRLEEIAAEANETVVEAEEILSNRIYYYICSEDRLIL